MCLSVSRVHCRRVEKEIDREREKKSTIYRERGFEGDRKTPKRIEVGKKVLFDGSTTDFVKQFTSICEILSRVYYMTREKRVGF